MYRARQLQQPVAAGDRFYAVANYTSGSQLLEYSAGAWRQVNISWLGTLSANQNGDLAVLGRPNNVTNILLRTSEGRSWCRPPSRPWKESGCSTSIPP